MQQRTALVGLGLGLVAWIAIMPLDPMAPTDPKPVGTPIARVAPVGPVDERDQDGQPPINHPLIDETGKSHSPCWIVVPPTGDGWAQCEDGYIERP